MAKKNDVFPYGSAAIPSGEAKYSVIRWGWNGLNRTDSIDSGAITDCEGVVIDPPYVIPSVAPVPFLQYSGAISVHGFGDRLFVIHTGGGDVKIDCVNRDGTKYSGVLGKSKGTDEDYRPRSMIQFNVASNLENIVEAEYVRKLLVFPDSYSMDYEISGNFTPADLGDTYPDLKLATVYGSRVFGVSENLVHASAYNNYAGWDLDTADDINDANAWASMSQSNVKADGEFTAIAAYDNHVVLFKKDFMQLVYNTKNPFRIADVGTYGCDNAYAVAEAGGVLYFASPSAVYAFAGGTPKEIGKNLDVSELSGAVLGAWGDVLYMFADGKLYRYSDGVWSCSGKTQSPIRQFASCDWGIVGLFEDGSIRIIDWRTDESEQTPEYGSADGGDWWFETDLMAVGKLDVRRVKKFSMLCEMEEGTRITAYLLRANEKFDPEAAVALGTVTGGGMKMLRVLTRMTSSYMHRLRIVGRGKAKIHAAEIQIAWGGDLYVEG